MRASKPSRIRLFKTSQGVAFSPICCVHFWAIPRKISLQGQKSYSLHLAMRHDSPQRAPTVASVSKLPKHHFVIRLSKDMIWLKPNYQEDPHGLKLYWPESLWNKPSE